MASTLQQQPHDDPSNGSASVFLPTVCLYEWWLILAEKEFQGKRLGVAGFTSPKEGPVKRAIRVFKSAPITKMYDFSTLETADGVCVIIKGLMNKSLTTDNGFSSEVCRHFVFGFPSNWEKFVAEQGKSDCLTERSKISSHHHVDQISPGGKDQTSPAKYTSGERASQPGVRTRSYHAAQTGQTHLGSNNLGDDVEETPEEPSSPSTLVKSKKLSNHKDVSSQHEHKNANTGSIHGSRNRSENDSKRAQTRTNANLPNEGQEEIEEEQQWPSLVKSGRSSHRPIDQIIPGEKDQTSPVKYKSGERASQPSVRTRSHRASQSGQTHLGSNNLVDDVEEAPEEPSSPSTLVKSKKLSNRKDHSSTREYKNANIGSAHSSGNRSETDSKRAQTRSNGSLPKEGPEEIEEEQQSPSRVKSGRSSHRPIATVDKGDDKREKTSPGVTPKPQETVRTADSFKRSRSGRVLLPRLAFWRNELPIYDENRNLAGVQGMNGVVDDRDSRNSSSMK